MGELTRLERSESPQKIFVADHIMLAKALLNLVVSAALCAVIFTDAPAAHAQGIITTIAGAGFIDNVPALQSRLGWTEGIAADPQGNIFFSDSGRILRIDVATGVLTVVAGRGRALYDYEGRIEPAALYIDRSGDIHFFDRAHGRFCRLNIRQGTITTLAGRRPLSENHLPAVPPMESPRTAIIDPSGHIYYATGTSVQRIDAISGLTTTLAGSIIGGFSGDGGPASLAILNGPNALAIDPAGNIYISDAGNYRVRKVTLATGIISTVAGTGRAEFSGDDGPALQASLANPNALALDSGGNLYIADGHRVRRVSKESGVVMTVAGNGDQNRTGDGGPARQAAIRSPAALTFAANGDLLIAGAFHIRMVSMTAGIIQTVAGTSENGDGGRAETAILQAHDLALDPAGNFFIAEADKIRRIDRATRIISTIAGGGEEYWENVPARETRLVPNRIAFDPDGNLVVAEETRIRRIDRSGVITTIAGSRLARSFSGDGGPARDARFTGIGALAVDHQGNIWVWDQYRVRRIDALSGIIQTVAGNGEPDYAEPNEGEPATEVSLGPVTSIAVDRSGTLYLLTSAPEGPRFLKVSPQGKVSRFAGNGGPGYTGDGGPASLASFEWPGSLLIDPAGNIFLGDFRCIRRIAADSGIVQTVAGTGGWGLSNGDDGPATEARIFGRGPLAYFDGDLYLLDSEPIAIRKVSPGLPPALPGQPRFVEAQVVNAASFQSRNLAPGTLISIFGNYLGPATPGYLTLDREGRVTRDLAGVKVFINEMAAPLTYVSAGQINAIVPYGVGSAPRPLVRVEHAEKQHSISHSFGEASIGFFPNAVVNQDGSLHSELNPAPRGSYVVLYGTGLGAVNPALPDGAITPLANIPRQTNGTTLWSQHSGTRLEPAYLGPAPGLVSGVFQLNIQIPLDLPIGANEIVFQSTSYASYPARVTLYVSH